LNDSGFVPVAFKVVEDESSLQVKGRAEGVDPKVSFVVPCYKLGHLLPECVQSILAQTYENLEILIMDDCSPDHTPQVAGSFSDPRVKHVRNEKNLGHLRNYNKGISLATGKYVWLISADDSLRASYVVERYVRTMEAHPEVGYAFCPGMGVSQDNETGVLKFSVYRDRDAIVRGRELLLKLLHDNLIVAAAAMVRKESYEKTCLGPFPLDLPFAGDWYLWLLLALHYDVAYFREPMVRRRVHSRSMTSTLLNESPQVLTKDDIAVPWRIRAHAEKLGDPALVRMCDDAIVDQYAKYIFIGPSAPQSPSMTLNQFEESLNQYTREGQKREALRARVFAAVADRYYWVQQIGPATEFYRRSLGQDPMTPRIWLKYLFLRMGAVGISLRQSMAYLRQAVGFRKS
jgi:glycosyltransferase involved in cell wall biosynthesis